MKPATSVVPVDAYDVHGVTLAVRGDFPAARLLDARFAPFPRRAGVETPDLTFEFRGSDAPDPGLTAPPGATRPIYDLHDGEVLYSDTRDEIYIRYGGGVRVQCDIRRGHTRICVLQPSGILQWLASHLFFTLPFEEVLKRRGLFSLHAAGLGVAGRALLLAGTSGSGKTTLAYVLMRSGFDFLADDTVFLAEGSRGPRVLAFPEELDMTRHAGELFPALRHLAESMPVDGPKHRVRPQDLVLAPTIAWECRPCVLVFPRVAHTTRSVLTQIDATEALLDLVPNVLLTEPGACQAHLDILGRLARESRCYRLETGRDFDRLPGLLRSLLS